MHIVETKTLRVFLESYETIETAVKELEKAGFVVLSINKALPKSFCDVFDVVVKIENSLYRSRSRD